MCVCVCGVRFLIGSVCVRFAASTRSLTCLPLFIHFVCFFVDTTTLKDYRDFKLSSAVLQVPLSAAMEARKLNTRSKRKATHSAARWRKVNNAPTRTLPAGITRNLAVNTGARESLKKTNQHQQQSLYSNSSNSNSNSTSMRAATNRNDLIQRQSLNRRTTLRTERYHSRRRSSSTGTTRRASPCLRCI